MHRNSIWLAFLLVFTGVTAFFLATAGREAYLYFSRSGSAPAYVAEWKIEGVARDRYVAMATYTFRAGESEAFGEGALQGFVFRSAAAAQASLPRIRETSWKVWYNPSSPSANSLEKVFPTRSCLYAAILLGVLIYLVGLGVFVARRDRLSSH